MNYVKQFFTRKRIIIGIIVLLLITVGIIYSETRSSVSNVVAEDIVVEPYDYIDPDTPYLAESEFVVAAENDSLLLKVHAQSGHFHVENKETGSLFRSYPNPEQWELETSGQTWINNLRSPLMVNIINFEVRRDQARWTSLLQEEGIVEQFALRDDGFSLTFAMPKQGIAIPVEVTLQDDFVQTKIIDAGIVESDWHSIAGIRLYPFFGAQQSLDLPGYLLIPDGSGALIAFDKNRTSGNAIYTERVYGTDWSYGGGSFSNRNSVTMPIFGIHFAQQGFLAVIHEGAEYAEIIGSPSGALSEYNWTTAGFTYRHMYFQPTSRGGETGFNTYERERITGYDRAIRYHILDDEEAGYVGMASRYRQYLMDEQGLQPNEMTSKDMPLHVGLYGGDVEEGFLFDSYVPITTTDQAAEIVDELTNLGINNMAITYFGWQKGGNSAYGGNLAVDRRIGGKRGMNDFIQYAHDLGYPVYLDASIYGYNNTGKDGFRRQRDGLRNLASDLSEFVSRIDNSTVTFVSPLFARQSLFNDLSYFESLGVNGLLYGNGLGENLSTDFNEHHLATRAEVTEVVQDIYGATKQRLGSSVARNPFFSLLRGVDHVYDIYDDHSYDLFIDEAVPFSQIALHGLVSYSTSYINERNDYQIEFLRSIEYGAEPSIILSYAPTDTLLRTKSLSRFFSTHYNDWLVELVKQYQRYNDELSVVQSEFIVDHRKLANGVKETSYANGTRVIVNYNQTPFHIEGHIVAAEDFIVIQGGNKHE